MFSRGLFAFQEVQGVFILELTVLGCSQAYLKLKTLKVRSNSGGSGRGVGIWCSGDSREMREAEQGPQKAVLVSVGVDAWIHLGEVGGITEERCFFNGPSAVS